MHVTSTDAVRILTLNVFGVFVAQHLDERMELIGAHVLPNYDIICLQEQFSEAHLHLILKACEVASGIRAGQWHVHRAVHGASASAGPGLTTLSRLPILSGIYVPFTVAGRRERVWEFDAFSARGVQVVRISRSTAAELVVFNTHMIPQFQDYSKLRGGYRTERNAPYRLVQAYEFAALISTIVGRRQDRAVVVVCGDFNAGPNSPEMQTIHAVTDHAGLFLNHAVTKGSVFTLTTDNVYNNAASWSYLRVMGMQEQLPQRVDHVLYAAPSGMRSRFRCASANVVFDLPVKHAKTQRELFLSDHSGVEAIFSFIADEAADDDAATSDTASGGDVPPVRRHFSNCGPHFSSRLLLDASHSFRRVAHLLTLLGLLFLAAVAIELASIVQLGLSHTVVAISVAAAIGLLFVAGGRAVDAQRFGDVARELRDIAAAAKK